MRLRRLTIWLAAVAMVWIGLASLLGVELTENAMHIARRPITPEDIADARANAGKFQAKVTDVTVTADDGAILRAWNFVPSNNNGDAVIVLHGVGDNRTGMLGYAALLMQHGYQVLAPDSRGHGASGGAEVTYGVKEARDVESWYRWLEANEAPRCIYALGDSMGAAIALDSVAKEPGFCAVVAESPFSSFRDAAYIRIGQGFGTGPWVGRTVLLPAVKAGFIYARVRYGVNLDDSSPAKAAAHSKVPILLIHRLADDNLPPVNSVRIKAADPAAELWEPAGAGHLGAIEAAPEEYERRVVGWFESHDRAPIYTPSPKPAKTLSARDVLSAR
jgi:uncharacterized protein